MKLITKEIAVLLNLLKGKETSSIEEVYYDHLDRLLKRHKLFPLAERLLHSLPEDLHSEWKKSLMDWSARSLLYVAEMKAIAGFFHDQSEPVIFLKGPLLTKQLYETFHERQYTDIDLLVEPGAENEAIEVLMKKGYILITPSKNLSDEEWNNYFRFNNDVVLRNPETGITLEIHLGIYVEQLLEQEKESILLADKTEVEIQGTSFQTLANENNFLYLCFHAAKHMFFRLCWLRDLGKYIEKMPMDVEKVIDLARKLEMEKSLSLALSLTKEYCGIALPGQFEDFIKKHRYPCLLKLAHRIILGPGELVYENYRRFRKVENQVEGINNVRLKHLFNQVLFLVLLRKGIKKRMRFLLYQLRKRR